MIEFSLHGAPSFEVLNPEPFNFPAKIFLRNESEEDGKSGLLSLYGPWSYGPMALALRPYGPIFSFQEL